MIHVMNALSTDLSLGSGLLCWPNDDAYRSHIDRRWLIVLKAWVRTSVFEPAPSGVHRQFLMMRLANRRETCANADTGP